jgi:hypothetical protein
MRRDRWLFLLPDYLMAVGLQRCPLSMATRPHPPQTYFMAASLSLHICPVFVFAVPQKLQFALSPQGLHKWPGSFATAPQFLHVYAMMLLLFSLIVEFDQKN